MLDSLHGASGGDAGGGLSKVFIASASRDKSIRLWCAGTGECISCYEFHRSWVKDILFHPFAPYILSCSDDYSIRVIDLKVSQSVSRQMRIKDQCFLCFGLVCVFYGFLHSCHLERAVILDLIEPPLSFICVWHSNCRER